MEQAVTRPQTGAEKGLDAILLQLKTHDARISGVELKLDSFGTDLHEIKTSIDLLGAKPSFDVSKAIQLMVQGGLLFSMVVSGIIWLAVQLNASSLTALQSEDKQISARITDMKERLIRLENRAPDPLR